jgi:hypothetical protein
MAGQRKQLVSFNEARIAKGQHTKPCSDCPWARTSLAGWLGQMSPAEWIADVHGESLIECHTLLGAQCAGAAIYRANVVKLPRDPETLRLPRDRERVFATPREFLSHHEAGPCRRRA